MFILYKPFKVCYFDILTLSLFLTQTAEASSAFMDIADCFGIRIPSELMMSGLGIISTKVKLRVSWNFLFV